MSILLGMFNDRRRASFFDERGRNFKVGGGKQ
jgi:hypothetical protein